jgi:hypothetical protein
VTTLLLRRGTAAAWAAGNPVLALGEQGYETDTKKRKVGDGVTAWTSLPYDTATSPVQSVAGRTGTVILAKADVGLGNVDNTTDAAKPVSTAQQAALDGKAAASHTHPATQISDATAAGRALLTAVDAAAQRTAIGLGSVDNTSDANKPVSTAQAAADALARLAWARNPDVLIAGAVTRDSNGAATSAPVQWPDGSPGTYTALVVSTAFPGAVDSYQITYGSPVTKTYTQPTITRDAATGAAAAVPAVTVA